MSTFDGVITEIPEIAVDHFEYNNYNAEAYFLSHIHTDHTRGLSLNFKDHLEKNKYFLYTSGLTVLMLERKYPYLKPYLKTLDLKNSTLITFKNGQNLSVTTLPAGHCIGSIMFLFETPRLKILYTGDIRIEKNGITKFRSLHNSLNIPKPIDTLYFDSTFFNESYNWFPTRTESAQKICSIIKEWIRVDPKNMVYIKQSAYYGSESLIIEISKSLNMKLYVNKNIYEEVYKFIPEMDTTFTYDKSKTQIYCYKFQTDLCSETYLDKKNLFLNPSAYWWTNNRYLEQNTTSDEVFIQRDQQFVRICYSSHSSYPELLDIIEYLKPTTLVPCVVPNNAEDKNALESYIAKYNTSHIFSTNESIETVDDDLDIKEKEQFKNQNESYGILNFSTNDGISDSSIDSLLM